MFVNKITQVSLILLQLLRTDSASTRGGEKITRELQDSSNVFLVSFNPESDEHAWKTSDDPVMGGVSSSTYTIKDNFGVWDGVVEDVPSLEDPGFCTLSINDGNDEIFPDASGTNYMVIVFGDDSGLDEVGLPLESFYFQAGVSQQLISYQADLGSNNCCGRYCQVAWSDFNFFGTPLPVPSLSGKLDKINMVGLGTSGVNGNFSVKIKAFGATNTVLPCL